MDQEIELNADERFGYFGKILLACNSILFMANNVNAVDENFKLILSHKEQKGEAIDALENVHNRNQEILKDTFDRLFETYEYLADCLNGIDCVCDVDISILNPVYAALTDKKIKP